MSDKRCTHSVGLSSRDGAPIICQAGIDVRALVGGPDFGWLKRCPCSGRYTDAVPCAQYQAPSAEEVAAELRALQVHFVHMDNAYVLIRRQHQQDHQPAGTVECPACQQTLHYTVAACNGHIWGHCETDECLAWME